jgi:hypothetical protein
MTQKSNLNFIDVSSVSINSDSSVVNFEFLQNNIFWSTRIDTNGVSIHVGTWWSPKIPLHHACL